MEQQIPATNGASTNCASAYPAADAATSAGDDSHNNSSTRTSTTASSTPTRRHLRQPSPDSQGNTASPISSPRSSGRKLYNPSSPRTSPSPYSPYSQQPQTITSPYSQQQQTTTIISSPPRSPYSQPPTQPFTSAPAVPPAAPAPDPPQAAAPVVPIVVPQQLKHSQPSLWSLWSGRQQQQSSVSPPPSASSSPPPPPPLPQQQQTTVTAPIIISPPAVLSAPATPVWSVNPPTPDDSSVDASDSMMSVSDDGTTLSELVLNLQNVGRGIMVNNDNDYSSSSSADPAAVFGRTDTVAAGRIMYSRSNDDDEDDTVEIDDMRIRHYAQPQHSYGSNMLTMSPQHPRASAAPAPASPTDIDTTSLSSISHLSISTGVLSGSSVGNGNAMTTGSTKFASPATMAAGSFLLSSSPEKRGGSSTTPSTGSRQSSSKSRQRGRRRTRSSSSDVGGGNYDHSDDDDHDDDQGEASSYQRRRDDGGFFPIFKSSSERGSSSASWSRSQGGGGGGDGSFQSAHTSAVNSSYDASSSSSLGLPPPPPLSAQQQEGSFRQILALEPPQPDQDYMDRPLSPPVRSPQSASFTSSNVGGSLVNAEGAELIPALPAVAVDTHPDVEDLPTNEKTTTTSPGFVARSPPAPQQQQQGGFSYYNSEAVVALSSSSPSYQHERSGSYLSSSAMPGAGDLLSGSSYPNNLPSHKPTFSSTSISSPPIPGTTNLLSSIAGSIPPSHRPTGSTTSIASPPIPRALSASKVWTSPVVSPSSSPPPPASIIGASSSASSHATTSRPSTEKSSPGNTTLAFGPSGSSGVATGASCESGGGGDRRFLLTGGHRNANTMPGGDGPTGCRWRPLILFFVFLTLLVVLVTLMVVRNQSEARSSSGIVPEVTQPPLPLPPIYTTTSSPTPEPATKPSAEASPAPTLRPTAKIPDIISTIRPVPTASIETLPPPAETPSTSLPVTSAPVTTTTTTTAPSTTLMPAVPTSFDHDALYNLILEAAPNSAVLAIEDEASPQAFAFNWMIENTAFGNQSQERILQRYALAVLYFSSEGDGWTNNTNWLVHEDECQWFNKASLTTMGGPCTDDGLLLALDLSRNSLNGTLPGQEEFALLTELVVVNFNRNPLTGAIPPPLLQGGGILPNLERIDLANTDMDGPLLDNALFFSPEPALRVLNLAGTPVTGSVPSSWGVFVNLQDLLLHGTSLTGIMPQTVCENQNLAEVSANCDEILNCTCCTICCYTNVVQQCDYVNN